MTPITTEMSAKLKNNFGKKDIERGSVTPPYKTLSIRFENVPIPNSAHPTFNNFNFAFEYKKIDAITRIVLTATTNELLPLNKPRLMPVFSMVFLSFKKTLRSLSTISIIAIINKIKKLNFLFIIKLN